MVENQIQEKDSLQLRMESFPNIIDLLNGNKTDLFSLKEKRPGSVFDGDYGLFKVYELYSCILGLKEGEKETDITIYCAPQSWMSDRNGRNMRLICNKRPIYYKDINKIDAKLFNDNF